MPRTFPVYTLIIMPLILGCALLTGSVPHNTPTPELLNTQTTEVLKSKLPELTAAWTIRMEHSGGIMGLLRSIEISSDGKFTVIDERANKTVTGELPIDELSKIKEQVSTSEYIPAIDPKGMACADCFIYDLEIQGNGEKFTIQLNDISLPNSGLELLVTHLRGLIETALK